MPRSLAPTLVLLLGACAISAPADAPASDQTPRPASTPEPTASSSVERPSASPEATDAATPVPTVAGPSPAPDGSLDLEATGCPGGVVLHWSASVHPSFHHYIALRSPSFEIEPAYPPIAPAVDWGETYATDRFVTSAADASILPSATRWWYRVMAYDVEGNVLGASPVRGARLAPVDRMGPVTLTPGEDGAATLSWGPYRGPGACFTAYRVLYGTGGSASTLLGTVSDPQQRELATSALAAGVTYTFRVEAVRVTTLGTFVTGRTEDASLGLP